MEVKVGDFAGYLSPQRMFYIFVVEKVAANGLIVGRDPFKDITVSFNPEGVWLAGDILLDTEVNHATLGLTTVREVLENTKKDLICDTTSKVS